MTTNDLIRLATNTKTFEDFKQHLKSIGPLFTVGTYELCLVKKVQLILYQENRLSADNQRDLAQLLDAVFRCAEEL
jgi:hypothetical protein